MYHTIFGRFLKNVIKNHKMRIPQLKDKKKFCRIQEKETRKLLFLSTKHWMTKSLRKLK